MKRLAFTLLTFLFVIVSGYAQTTLTFEKHALLAGENNPMKICTYIAPGEGGENVTWDFSALKFKEDFVGYLNKTTSNIDEQLFGDANTVLQEFNSKFYFNITKDGMDQLGYASMSGRSVIYYGKPFKKMVFPFTYNDEFYGYFDGNYSYDNGQKGTIDGNYSVKADGAGKLILPNNTVYENTLRVHTEKFYTLDLGTSEQLVRINTYRWFTENHRYPILVLIEMKTKTGDRVSVTTQAAYNTDALKVTAKTDVFANADVKLYPTNVSTELNLEFGVENGGTAYAEVIDLSGKKVMALGQINMVAGHNHFVFNSQLQDLPQGAYYIHVQGDNLNIVEPFNLIMY